MKFKSRKDIFFKIITFCLFIFFGVMFYLIYTSFQKINFEFVWTVSLLILAFSFLFWTSFGTEYELTQTELKYKCGPIRGKIQVDQIKEIINGKTLWVGMKPATARNGLIIKYNKFEEIYISPETNDLFVNKILELNKNIKITKQKIDY